MNADPVIAVVGPTASGKTRRAVALARALGGEIISADSRQIYCGMDIGTGKDLADYGDTPVHLVDIYPAGYRCDLCQWLSLARRADRDIRARGHRPIVCGGTGLYLESYLSGINLPHVPPDPSLRRRLEGKPIGELREMLSSMKRLHNVTDVDTPARAIRAIEISSYYRDHPAEARLTEPHPIPSVIIGIDVDRDTRRRLIAERLARRIDSEGMVSEVRGLIEGGVSPDDLIYYGLEYKFVTLYLTGRITLDQMRSQLLVAIHQFAKRQLTWLRGMVRRGFTIHWVPYGVSEGEFLARVGSVLGVAGDGCHGEGGFS